MTAISRIVIENFQSHEDTVIELDEGLNVIVGPSDQGKSAVLRAIKWVLYNEPRGTEFIRHGKTFAKVSLEFSNGYTIIRERSKNKNRYEIINQEGESTAYEGFGNSIPEEVYKVHGIQKIVLDSDISSSINIGEQLEGPFLLSEAPSVRAKALGRLTGIHIIDRAARDTSTDLRRENQSSERIRNELEEVDEKLVEFEKLRQIEKAIEDSGFVIKNIEGLLERHDELCNKRGLLELLKTETEYSQGLLKRTETIVECGIIIENLLILNGRLEKLQRSQKSIRSIEPEVNKYGEIILRTGELDKPGDLVNQANKSNNLLEKIIILKQKIESNIKEIKREERLYESGKSIDNAEAIYARILLESERLNRVADLHGQFNSIQKSVEDGKKYLRENNDELNNMSKAFGAYLKKAGRCPICNSELNDIKTEEILKHYCVEGG